MKAYQGLVKKMLKLSILQLLNERVYDNNKGMKVKRMLSCSLLTSKQEGR